MLKTEQAQNGISYAKPHVTMKMKVKSLSLSDSFLPRRLYPTTLLHPWDFASKSTGVACHFLLQRIFPTQGQNPGLPHCRQTLYRLSHQGSPTKTKLQFLLSQNEILSQSFRDQMISTSQVIVLIDICHPLKESNHVKNSTFFFFFFLPSRTCLFLLFSLLFKFIFIGG